MAGGSDYRSKCPRCGYSVIIRLGGVHCMACDWVGRLGAAEHPDPPDIENVTEVRKVGEDRFVPPSHQRRTSKE
jgi:hypothetical protein